ncbi:MAG: hypothetical protein LC772_10290, partial [Chloroflexi bacterium]|nr:hypothetical protein [Chloroflexota bacterium]
MTRLLLWGCRPASARALVPLGILLVFWLWAFLASPGVRGGPSGRGIGGDFAIFLGAATVLDQGGNPYDPSET